MKEPRDSRQFSPSKTAGIDALMMLNLGVMIADQNSRGNNSKVQESLISASLEVEGRMSISAKDNSEIENAQKAIRDIHQNSPMFPDPRAAKQETLRKPNPVGGLYTTKEQKPNEGVLLEQPSDSFSLPKIAKTNEELRGEISQKIRGELEASSQKYSKMAEEEVASRRGTVKTDKEKIFDEVDNIIFSDKYSVNKKIDDLEKMFNGFDLDNKNIMIDAMKESLDTTFMRDADQVKISEFIKLSENRVDFISPETQVQKGVLLSERVSIGSNISEPSTVAGKLSPRSELSSSNDTIAASFSPAPPNFGSPGASGRAARLGDGDIGQEVCDKLDKIIKSRHSTSEKEEMIKGELKGVQEKISSDYNLTRDPTKGFEVIDALDDYSMEVTSGYFAFTIDRFVIEARDSLVEQASNYTLELSDSILSNDTTAMPFSPSRNGAETQYSEGFPPVKQGDKVSDVHSKEGFVGKLRREIENNKEELSLSPSKGATPSANGRVGRASSSVSEVSSLLSGIQEATKDMKVDNPDKNGLLPNIKGVER